MDVEKFGFTGRCCLGPCPRLVGGQRCKHEYAGSLGKGLAVKLIWPFLDPWDVVGLRTTARIWKIPEKYGPCGELFFLIKKGPVVFREMVDFGHCIPVETMKARAMCGLRMMEEMSSGTTSEDEEYKEHNVGNLSLEVVEQGWSGGLVCLFLEDWELSRAALSCHLALDLLCQEMQEAW